MAKVNLDALISREDFEVEENINSGTKKDRIAIEDIKADSLVVEVISIGHLFQIKSKIKYKQ